MDVLMRLCKQRHLFFSHFTHNGNKFFQFVELNLKSLSCLQAPVQPIYINLSTTIPQCKFIVCFSFLYIFAILFSLPWTCPWWPVSKLNILKDHLGTFLFLKHSQSLTYGMPEWVTVKLFEGLLWPDTVRY